MAKATLKGFDEFFAAVEKIEGNTEAIAKAALYDGTEVMANALRTEISALSTVDEMYNIIAFKTGKKMRLSEKQKQGLLKSLGVATFEVTTKNINTKIGFKDYNDIKTKKYPKGQPNQMIARTLESGSSYMDKNPFIRRAINKTKKQAEEAMKEAVEERLKKEMEG